MRVPPASHEARPTEFGMQDKKQSLHVGARQKDGSHVYECTVNVAIAVVDSAAKLAIPKFGGPFVHGQTDAPFLYLSYREAQEGSPWIRRLKISLKTITHTLVQEAIDHNKAIEGAISGDGSGTVPLLGKGWHLIGETA